MDNNNNNSYFFIIFYNKRENIEKLLFSYNFRKLTIRHAQKWKLNMIKFDKDVVFNLL